MGGATDRKSVSAVILTWNRRDDLRFTLTKLCATGYSPLEVIVVDNNSTDGTGDMVRAEFPHVRYLPQNSNAGIAGYNAGFKAATGHYVAVFDSDSYPDPRAIERMCALFDKYPEAGIVAFDVHSAGEDQLPVPAFDGGAREVFGYHGAGAGIRREVFTSAGYWYEPFFLYFNEADHAIRALKAGWRIIHSPAVRAYHQCSAAARPSERGAFFYTRNAFWVVWRHYPVMGMLGATAYLVYHCISESIHQRAPVYLKAMVAAFLGACGVWRGRAAASEAVSGKIRIPLKLVFTRFG